MKSVKRKCSRCGNPGLHAKKRPAIRTVAGHSFKASVPALVCNSCGAVYFNGPALDDFDLAVVNKLASAGVSDSEAIKFMRKAVGLPAVTLAELLDTSPETVSRWERRVSHIDRRLSPSWRGSSWRRLIIDRILLSASSLAPSRPSRSHGSNRRPTEPSLFACLGNARPS